MPERIGESPVRGWSWNFNPGDKRVSAFRNNVSPDGRGNLIGLRVAFRPG